ncbi:Glycerophosphocholine phosphodiesterase [Pseudogymnoascus australis]
MKFGRNLPRNQVPEWASNYINYKQLKKLIRAIAAEPEHADLAEFFFSLDRNLETVDEFYNRKYSKASRRLRLLEHRDHDDIEELRAALLDLRGQLRKLQWFGEVNRRGFIKITKKLDKKVSTFIQKSYIESRVDPKQFATNQALSESMKSINDWLSALNDAKTPESKSIHSVNKPMLNLPSGLLETVKGAVKNDDAPILKEILAGAEFEADDPALKSLQLTLLQRSITSKSKKCIDFLLAEVEDFDEPDDINQRNCLHRLVLAINKTNKDQAAQLLETNQFIHPAAQPLLGPRASKCAEAETPSLDGETVNMLSYVLERMKPLQYGAIAAKDSYGRLPLHYAAQLGIVVVCEVLMKFMRQWGLFNVEDGIDAPEWQDHEGLAPLHLSVIGGHYLTSKALFEAEGVTGKAARSSKSSAVLNLATKSNYYKIVRLLVDSGVDVNWQDAAGETALHVAARFGHVECAKILLDGTVEQKADPDICEKYFEWTPVHIAAVDGHLPIVELLLEAHADVNREDSSGWNAREHAALRGHIDIATLLAEYIPQDNESIDGSTGSGGSPPGIASLEERNSQTTVKESNPVRAFGHRYLTDQSMVLVSLGSMDTRKTIEAVNLEKIPISEAHSTQLDTALSIIVSAVGAEGDQTTIDLPVQENIATEPFTFLTKDPSKVKLMFDLVPTYSGSQKNKLGRAVALLSSIRSTVGSKRANLAGDLSVPIVAADTLEVLGTVNFNFLIITPFSHPNMEITETQTYWKSLTSPMVIGHRGLGKNQAANKSLQLGENTIQSFISAANLGANYVEFDVQLTKDHVPVIYHDFLVSETGIDAPVHTLTLEQFLHVNDTTPARSQPPSPLRKADTPSQALPVLPALTPRPRSLSMSYAPTDTNTLMEERMKYTHDFKAHGYKANSRGRFIQQPFTTLEELFRKLPANVGFNIELKYPMLHESEEHHMDAYAVELNSFTDAVLAQAYELGNQRHLIFSSFNPDVCLVLSFKQPNFPILFLSDAGASPVGDIRASSLQEAIRFASRWNLLGIVAQAAAFCAAPRLVKVVKEHGLVCVSYGVQNNDPKMVQLQVKEGIDAVIVDSVLAIRKGLQQSEELAKEASEVTIATAVQAVNGSITVE